MPQIYVGSLAFFYKKRTPWKDRLDQGITRMVEGGIIQKSYNDFMEEKSGGEGGGEPFPLNMTHLQGPFMIIIFGLVVSLVCFLVEISINKKKIPESNDNDSIEHIEVLH